MPDLSYEESLQKLISLLQVHEVFTAFSPQEIAEFAGRANISFYEQGAKIVKQGEKGDEFFVVISGQLRAIDVNHDPPQILNYLTPSSIFGMRAILDDSPRSATIEVIIDARLATFNKDDWIWLVHQNDRVMSYFQNLEREFDKPSLIDFPGRQWDEVVVLAVKRHFLALLAKLPIPLAILILPLMFLIVTELLGFKFFAISADTPVLMMIVTFFAIISAALIVYQYLDWRNDDFIITTKRAIHIERILLYGKQRNEAPLTRIQDVTVVSFDLVDRFFDYNHLEISTAGAGVIRFSGIPKAREMRELIFQERRQAMERVGAADLGAIRQMIAERLAWEQALEKPIVSVAEEAAMITKHIKTRRLPGFLDYLWPKMKEIDDDGAGGTTITWRKHYFYLFRTTFLPLAALLTFSYLLLASLFGWFPFLSPLPLLGIVLGLAAVGSFVWYFLRYDDWYRDRYILTNRRIVDVESTPFRLRGEQRREGTFDNIQNITYNIPNFFHQLLNIGDVVIETAGVERTFTFERVFKPNAVQEEIFNRMVRYQQVQRERTRDATTDQLVEVIKEYHNLFEKTSRQPKSKSKQQ